MAKEDFLEIKEDNIYCIKRSIIRFSLRRSQPHQVQRDSLNSFQNTPKAETKVGGKEWNVKCELYFVQ